MFDQVTMDQLVEKQRLLTGYLELLVAERLPEAGQITPSDPAQRGCQLSFRFPDVHGVHSEIRRRGVAVRRQKGTALFLLDGSPWPVRTIAGLRDIG